MRRYMNTTSVNYASSWPAFIIDLQEKILPIYEEHEKTFDPFGVHGRIHICRSVIFAEWMARFYNTKMSIEIDFYAVRVAAALHDSGRRANGVDLWEGASASNCIRYVEEHSPFPQNAEYPGYVGGLIGKRPSKDTCKWIVRDADVLEIMRPCCGHGGIDGFRRDFLHFAGARDPFAVVLPDAEEIREELIQEAWKWISETERIKLSFSNSATFFVGLLDKLGQERRRYPMLSSLV
jgi:hypothetical protein